MLGLGSLRSRFCLLEAVMVSDEICAGSQHVWVKQKVSEVFIELDIAYADQARGPLHLELRLGPLDFDKSDVVRRLHSDSL